MKRPDPMLAGNIKGDSFARRMFKARERAGISRKEAAEAIGLSANHLRRIEVGGVQMVSDPQTLVRAAKVYGVSDVWLYAGGMATKFVPAWYCVQEQEAA